MLIHESQRLQVEGKMVIDHVKLTLTDAETTVLHRLLYAAINQDEIIGIWPGLEQLEADLRPVFYERKVAYED